MNWTGILLFLAAGLGQMVLLVFGLNWLYGTLLNRTLLTTLRSLLALFVLAGFCLFGLLFGWDLSGLWTAFSGTAMLAGLAAYVWFCVFLALVVLPALTLRRLLRQPPAVLWENSTTCVDVAAELGYRPVGRGKHTLMARLPGNQIFQVDFTERTLVLPRLPRALDGLTILHLTDLHLCGTPDRAFYQYVMKRCRDWEPDVVALTGDIVDACKYHGWIIPTLGHLRWRYAGLAILGNHDSWYEPEKVRRRLRRLGFRVPGNSWEKLACGAGEMLVIGNECHWFRPAPDLSACPTGLFRLGLTHTPDNMPWARRHDLDLLLAGHNHGGQVRLPVIGSILAPSRYSRRYDCGVFHEPPTVLQVGRGLGEQHPLRYNCRPEVVRLLLRCPAPPG